MKSCLSIGKIFYAILMAMVLAASSTTFAGSNWYVSQMSGKDTNDGLSEQTAFATIQKAVNVSSDGDSILVDDGVYSPISTTNKMVFISSQNGSELTSIDGGGLERCATLGTMDQTNSVLRGFTLRNGVLSNDVGGGSIGGTVVECIYRGNRGVDGGGAYGGVLKGCTLTNNEANHGGGAYEAVLVDCTLSENVATNGAGVYGGTVSNCMLLRNTAANHGGGAYESRINDSILQENSATEYGGGSYYGNLQSCTVISNKAWNGAGVAWSDIEGCDIAFNSADYFGGGAYSGGPKVLSGRNCTVRLNEAGYGGGACDGDFVNCTFSENWGYQGGGTYEAKCRKCRFEANEGGSAGGGAFYGELSECEVVGNIAQYGAGALGSVVSTSVFEDNYTYCGGGLYDGVAISCLIINNESVGAGGGSAFARLVNCTVYGNSARQVGGATYECELVNTIIFGNTTDAATEQIALTTATYSCLPESIEGVGNFVGDPLFQNASAGDFRLREDSPCIDAGDMNCEISELDCGGDWRVKYGKIDIGAFEASVATRSDVRVGKVTGGCVAPMSCQASLGESMTFRATGLRPFIGFYTNGVLVTSNPQLVWENVAYTGTLEARFDTSVNVKFYVDAENGDDANSGADQSNAMASISTAVNQSCDGDEILVYPGQYKPISVPNLRLVIKSVEGPENTVIDGGKEGRCASLSDETVRYYEPVETNTVLRGFTLKDGLPFSMENSLNYNRGGGVYGGTIVDCILKGNTCTLEGGAAVCSVLIGCRVCGNYASERGGGAAYCASSQCIFENNWTGNHGGALAGGVADNCLILGNNARWGGGTYSSKLVNCTVVGNTSTGVGGGCWGGSAVNCIIRNNIAPESVDVYSTGVRYCCTDVMQIGEGNIASDPAFIDCSSANYRIPDNSICAHVGDRMAVCSAVDLDGNPRVVRGLVSIGAYEPKSIPLPPIDPEPSKFEEAWGAWSEEVVSHEVLATKRFASWSHLRSCVWQMRDAMSTIEGRSIIPPSSNVVTLTLGQFAIPQSVYLEFPDDVAAAEEYGVPVWRMRVCESSRNGGEFVATIGGVEVMAENMPMYNRQKWSSYVYGDPPTWISGNNLDEWYAARARSRIECFLTLIPEDMYVTYLENRAAIENERSEDEAATKGLCLDVIHANLDTNGSHCVGVHVPISQKVALYGTSDLSNMAWAYYGTANLTNGTSAAGVVSTDSSFFVSLDNDLGDNDGDGIPNTLEKTVFRTDPFRADTSGGGLTDWEKIYHYDLNPAISDTDEDGFDDDEEIMSGMNPMVPATTQVREQASRAIRYFYDADDRLIGTYIGNGGGKSTTVLSPAGNPLEISERRAK